MIDLGLTKLALIGVVALIVIGPEKLPKVARMAGSLLGRAQRYLNDVKAEVSRDIELEELRKLQQSVQNTATELKSNLTNQMVEIEHSIHSIAPDSNPQPFIQSSFAAKTREFRRKKLVRHSALPFWYKQQQKTKTHLLSGAARVAKYRPR